MKKTNEGTAPVLNVIHKFLLALLVCLALVFLGGTVYSLFFRQKPAEFTVPSPTDRIFTGIGRLRLPAANNAGTAGTGQGPVVILSITFPYEPEDRPFTEELASRVGEFRSITGEYFLSFTAASLAKKSEEEIKKELLDRFNRILRLGKIGTLYFNDYLVLE